MKNITVSITEAQADRLKAVQREHGISVSFQIRSTLELLEIRKRAAEREQKASE